MAKNIDKTFNLLVRIQDSLFSTLELLEDLREDVEGYSGEIKRVLPPHVDTLISQLQQMIEGQDQHSVDNLIKFLDQIPLGDVRQKSPKDRWIDNEGFGENDDLDMNPDLSGGARSRISGEPGVMSESVLRKYARDEIRRGPRKRENVDPNWSFDRIRENVNEEDDMESDRSFGRASSHTAPYLKERFTEETRYKPQGAFSFKDLTNDPILRESMDNSDFMGAITGKSDIGMRAPSMTDEANEIRSKLEESENARPLSDWKAITQEQHGLDGADLFGAMQNAELVDPLSGL